MKKVIFIPLFLALSYCVIYGQTTTTGTKSPYLQTITLDKVWHIESGFWCPWGDCPCYGGLITMKIGNKKIFNEKEYYELLKSYQQQWIVVTYLREEEGKVFFYVEDCDKEYLMYDFTLNVGEEVFLIDPLYPFSLVNQENPCELTEDELYWEYKFKVTQIDEIEYNQVKRKRVKLSFYHYEERHDIWVEGIGGMDGITFTVSTQMTGSRCLKSCYESDDLIFEQVSPCCWTHLAINDIPQDLTRIFTDENNMLHIVNAKGISLMLYDLQGRKIKSIFPESDNVILNLSCLPRGMYIVVNQIKNITRKVIIK